MPGQRRGPVPVHRGDLEAPELAAGDGFDPPGDDPCSTCAVGLTHGADADLGPGLEFDALAQSPAFNEEETAIARALISLKASDFDRLRAGSTAGARRDPVGYETRALEPTG